MAVSPVSSVSQIFSLNGLIQWWKFPTQYFGKNGELGTDFGMLTGNKVGSITSGKVIYVGDPYAGDSTHSSLGYVVQVLAPDGNLYHYQHLKSPSVKVGDTINTGQSVGLSGGCPVGCYNADGTCSCTDAWTSGQHIEVRKAKYNPSLGVWNQQWVNPLSDFIALAGGSATVSSTGSSSSSSGSQDTSSSSSGGTVIPLNWQAQFAQEGQKIGIFLLAIVLAFFGFYLLFQKQANGLAKTAVKAAVA